MARTDYGPTVRSAMTQETEKIMSGKKAGTTHTAGKETPTPARPKPSQTQTQKKVTGTTDNRPSLNSKSQTAGNEDPPGQATGLPPDAFHVKHAAGIAHAILGNRRMM